MDKKSVNHWKTLCCEAGTVNPNEEFEFDRAFEVARAVSAEGMVLLKNENNTLPLLPTDKIAVFGSRQLWEKANSSWGFLIGGAGAGTVWGAPKQSPIDALRKKANEGKLSVYDDISRKYEENPEGYIPSDDDISAAKVAGVNKAVYIISRLEGEGGCEETWRGLPADPDSQPAPGEWYLSATEKNMLRLLSDAFPQVIVVFNTGNLMDTGFVKYGLDGRQVVDAALCAWYGGQMGPEALADVLVGDVNPSGKLVQTSADIKSFPSTAEFGRNAYSHYTEDIFVGYRYFETFDPEYSKVNYEFGFGLSYTEFKISNITYNSDRDFITVSADVTNVGNRAGKEVIQVYYSAPQRGEKNAALSKPGKELAGFAKTGELQPAESETVKVVFPVSDMASYDDTGATVARSAWLLEAGDYTVYVGNSIKNTTVAGIFKVDFLEIKEQLSTKMCPSALEERLLSDGNYEKLMIAGNKSDASICSLQDKESEIVTYPKTVTFEDVASGKHTLDELLSQMSTDELASFTASTERKGSAQNSGVGANRSAREHYGIPVAACLDGPCGIDSSKFAFPSEISIASTWNLDSAADCGSLVAAFCRGKAKGYSYGCLMWLGIGANIHRNPLGGRNFEYYSEDPLITGLMGAATTIKFQQKGDIGAVVKHLAANNQETARGSNDSRVSERALREIYLKGFEIILKVSDPVSVMTSYNRINGLSSWSYSEMLIDVVRREWNWQGMYMSDWDSVGENTLKMVLAGHNIKMGGGKAARAYDDVVNGYDEGKITREILIENAKYVLRALLRSLNREEKI